MATGNMDPNPTNLIPLRADIHRCFDRRWFAILPKPYPSLDPSLPDHTTEYVTQLLDHDAWPLWPEWQYVKPAPLRIGCHPYLFARFAWAILLRTKRFLTSFKDRYVIYVKDQTASKWVYTTGWLSGEELYQRYAHEGNDADTDNANEDSGDDDDEARAQD